MKPETKTNSGLKVKLRSYSEEILSLKLLEMESTESSKDATSTSTTMNDVVG